MMWTAVKKDKYGVAIYNFTREVEHSLQLVVGDTVEVSEQCSGWYRGYSLRNKSVVGIFPSTYIHLTQHNLDVDGANVAASEESVVQEVVSVLKEWHPLWTGLYTECHNSQFESVTKAINELIELRRLLLSGTLTRGQSEEVKAKITAIIDRGNKRLHLDVIPRVGSEQVNIDSVSPVELYNIHRHSSDASNRESTTNVVESVMTEQMFNVLMTVQTANTTLTSTDCELHFHLYDGHLLRAISERFIVTSLKLSSLSDICCLFVDIADRDVDGDLFLVVHAYKIGSLKEAEQSKTAVALYRRPFGCTVQKLNELFNVSRSNTEDIPFNVKLYQCSETEFASFHESLMKKTNFTANKDVGSISLCMRVIRGYFHLLPETEARLLRNAAVCNKIGFTDFISPDVFRNDLYVTIVRADLDSLVKNSPKNIEVRIVIVNSSGQEIQNCICAGAGEVFVKEYNSAVFYHNNSPRWNETLRLEIPVEQFQNLHLRFEFRHCSRKDRTEKKLIGFSFVRLAADDSTTLYDGLHELVLFKCDDGKKLRTVNPYYLSFTTHCSTVSGSDQKLNVMSSLVIETLLCSTKLTQNADLLCLLKWKTQPDKLYVHIEKLMKLDGKEIIKFLPDVLDVLFNMMTVHSQNNALQMPLVFRALMHVLSLLQDNKFKRFSSVLNNYIEHNFSCPIVYLELLACLHFILTDIVSAAPTTSLQDSFQKTFQVLEFIAKFIVRSRILHIRGFVENGDDKFVDLVNKVFTAVNNVLSVDNDLILQTQVVLVVNVPLFLIELLPVFPLNNICLAVHDLVKSIPKHVQPPLCHAKLKCLKHIARSPVFSAHEARCQLLPVYMSQLKRHLVNRQELRSCTGILFQVLTSLYKDQRLKVSVVDNVQLVVDCLLDVVVHLSLDTNSTNMSRLVVCVLSMLKLVSQHNYQQIINRFNADLKPLSEFLLSLLHLFHLLTIVDIFDADWLMMKICTNNVILSTVEFVSQTVAEKFLNAKTFNFELWNSYFLLLMQFIIEPCLQLEQFVAYKQRKIFSSYGDMRVRACYEMLSMWQNLDTRQRSLFVPNIVSHLLQVSLIPNREIRTTTIPILYDMLQCEQQTTGSFTQVEAEVICNLDRLVNEGYGDYQYKQLFCTILVSKLSENSSDWCSAARSFVESVAQLMEWLLDYRSVMMLEDSRDKQMTCIVKLLNFFKSNPSHVDIYVRYVYKLYDLHIASDNHTEAALTLLLHAQLLDWTDTQLQHSTHVHNRWSQHVEWQHKEEIYLRIIEEFYKGKSWEYGLPLCEELAVVYKSKILYAKLSRILKRQSEFYVRILQEHRPAPTYFRVGFYGLNFPPFLRNKEFVYRGCNYEKLESFQIRLMSDYETATLLATNCPPDDSIKLADVQCIQVCCVKPVAVIDDCFCCDAVPDVVTAFYRVNDVDTFQLDRPFYKGDKSDNEIKTMYIERTVLETSVKLPGIVRCVEVMSRRTIVLSPTQVAVDTMRLKNSELRSVINQYTESTDMFPAPTPPNNIAPFTMCLKGVVDAAVMGGITKYQQAFFTDEFDSLHPEHRDDIRQLKELIAQQVKIVRTGLEIHGRLVSQDQLPLHQHMVDMFTKMFESIKSVKLSGVDLSGLEITPRGSQLSLSSLSTGDKRGSTDTLESDSSSQVGTPLVEAGRAFSNKLFEKIRVVPKRSASSPPKWYTTTTTTTTTTATTEGQTTSPETNLPTTPTTMIRLKRQQNKTLVPQKTTPESAAAKEANTRRSVTLTSNDVGQRLQQLTENTDCEEPHNVPSTPSRHLPPLPSTTSTGDGSPPSLPPKRCHSQFLTESPSFNTTTNNNNNNINNNPLSETPLQCESVQSSTTTVARQRPTVQRRRASESIMPTKQTTLADTQADTQSEQGTTSTSTSPGTTSTSTSPGATSTSTSPGATSASISHGAAVLAARPRNIASLNKPRPLVPIPLSIPQPSPTLSVSPVRPAPLRPNSPLKGVHMPKSAPAQSDSPLQSALTQSDSPSDTDHTQSDSPCKSAPTCCDSITTTQPSSVKPFLPPRRASKPVVDQSTLPAAPVGTPTGTLAASDAPSTPTGTPAASGTPTGTPAVPSRGKLVIPGVFATQSTNSTFLKRSLPDN